MFPGKEKMGGRCNICGRTIESLIVYLVPKLQTTEVSAESVRSFDLVRVCRECWTKQVKSEEQGYVARSVL